MNNKLNLNTELEYFFIPARRTRSGKIVVVLHGKGDSLSPFKDFQKDTKLYDTEFLLLNAPKGYLDGYSWYADPPRMGTSLRHSRNLVMNILNQEDLVRRGEQVLADGKLAVFLGQASQQQDQDTQEQEGVFPTLTERKAQEGPFLPGKRGGFGLFSAHGRLLLTRSTVFRMICKMT